MIFTFVRSNSLYNYIFLTALRISQSHQHNFRLSLALRSKLKMRPSWVPVSSNSSSKITNKSRREWSLKVLAENSAAELFIDSNFATKLKTHLTVVVPTASAAAANSGNKETAAIIFSIEMQQTHQLDQWIKTVQLQIDCDWISRNCVRNFVPHFVRQSFVNAACMNIRRSSSYKMHIRCPFNERIIDFNLRINMSRMHFSNAFHKLLSAIKSSKFTIILSRYHRFEYDINGPDVAGSRQRCFYLNINCNRRFMDSFAWHARWRHGDFDIRCARSATLYGNCSFETGSRFI